jgi:hypothetical protein
LAWVAVIAYIAVVSIYFTVNYVRSQQADNPEEKHPIVASSQGRPARHKAEARQLKAPSIPVDLAFAIIALVGGFAVFALVTR